jgi:hypothetical protein
MSGAQNLACSGGGDVVRSVFELSAEGMVSVLPVSHTANVRSMSGVWVEALPAGIDSLEPGLVLAAMMTGVEDQNLSGYDRIRVLQAHQRLVSYFQARMLEDIASISELMTQLEADPEIAHGAAAA